MTDFAISIKALSKHRQKVYINFFLLTLETPRGGCCNYELSKKKLLKPIFKQESVTVMPPNKEVNINNIKQFVNWTRAFL